jgi:hypothetical protein
MPSAAMKDGTAVVYYRDIVTTWRLPDSMAAYEIYFSEKAYEAALGQENDVRGY